MKSQRAFWMQVQGATQTWVFSYPLTLQLDITNGTYASLGEGTFQLYDLSPATRKDLYLDWNNLSEYRQVTLRAGYLSWGGSFTGPIPGAAPVGTSSLTQSQIYGLPIIFQGNLTSGNSQRSGPNWITTLSAWDGGYGATRGVIPSSLETSSTFQIFQGLVAAMSTKAVTYAVGYIDPTLSSRLARKPALAGNPWVKIQEIATGLNADASIVAEKVYIVGKGNPVPGIGTPLPVVTSSTGLINTPRRQNTKIYWDMIFEPRLQQGQLVKLVSLEKEVNNTYTVSSLEHHGWISGAVCRDLTTTVGGTYGPGTTNYGAIQQSNP